MKENNRHVAVAITDFYNQIVTTSNRKVHLLPEQIVNTTKYDRANALVIEGRVSSALNGIVTFEKLRIDNVLPGTKIRLKLRSNGLSVIKGHEYFEYVVRSCFDGEYLAFKHKKRCTKCLPGRFLSQTDPGKMLTRCHFCQPGQYQSNIGQAKCTPCPLNTYNQNENATSLNFCHKCQPNSDTRGRIGQSSNKSCICKDNYYPVLPSSICHPCPAGAICRNPESGNSTLQLLGHWIKSANNYWQIPLEWATESEISLDDRFLRCKKDYRCLENNTCGIGYSGVLCEVCEIGYTRTYFGECAPCAENLHNNYANFILISLCLSMTLLFIFYAFKENMKKEGFGVL